MNPGREHPGTLERVLLFGRDIASVPPGDLTEVVAELAGAKTTSALFCNVHMLMLALEDEQLARAMDQAGFVFADGAPVAWLQRRVLGKSCRVVRGYEVMNALIQKSAAEGHRIGLLGSTDQVLDALVARLMVAYQGLTVAYRSSPPFVKGELRSTPEDIEAINEADLDWLFVSLGCPKQEKWIAQHGPALNCSQLAVGAAFDWLAGTTPKPPRWMEKSGLAWLFRLLHNPRRMWYRYLKYNTKFIVKVTKYLVCVKLLHR